jgi:alkylation response protein AidB-like acyl-CoA dehydrogenase
MRWELSEEQELFTTSLREWLAERAGLPAVRGWLDAGDPSSFERLFVGEGWAGVGFDEELGGQGGGLLEIALTARELGAQRRRRPAGCSRRSSFRRWPTSQRWCARHPSPAR